MKYLICLLLIIPCLVNGQWPGEVVPIISKDYQDLIRQENKPRTKLDSFISRHSIAVKLLRQSHSYQWPTKLNIDDTGGVTFIYKPIVQVYLKGSYRTSTEIRTRNRIPALQSGFVQGRSGNGTTLWRGPETNELFSYGPSVSSMEFDGAAYAFDNNGRLVPKGNGNGNAAQAYENDIFRTAVNFTQEMALNGYLSNSWIRNTYFDLNLKQTTENTFIRENRNSGHTLLTNIGFPIGPVSLKASYNYSRNRFSNSNRNGFLNRVYQNSLLTPVSFSNEQGNRLSPVQQRSFSENADNPLFLLDNEGNNARWRQHAGSVSLSYSPDIVEIRNTQSILSTRQQDRDVYQPGASAWPDGMLLDRNATSWNYVSRSEFTLKWLDDYEFKSSFNARHLFTHEQTNISYLPDNIHYRYKRDANDILLTATTFYDPGDIDLGLSLGNGFYTSNTSVESASFLPFINLQFGAKRIMTDVNMKITGGYRRFNSEPALNQSMAAANLLLLTGSQVSGYRPIKEVQRYDGLQQIEHSEWTSGLEFTYSYRYSLIANFYIRDTRGDIYPFHQGNNLLLDNIADIRKKGLEVMLTIRNPSGNFRKLYHTHTFSFITYRNTVKRVSAGYEKLPVAGFSNVYTALVAGQPLGILMGNDYVRDVYGRPVIGADGFPVAQSNAEIIGDPNPEFIIKSTHKVNWKNLQLSLALEWKKGGVAWNGTQAALDYYGRSSTTARDRSITGYIFDGVDMNGNKNDIPVNFYDVNAPVENNRWVRYGEAGVASDYIQKTDYLRIREISLSYPLVLNKFKDKLVFSVYLNNLIIWTPYKGADPSQLLYDQPGTTGIDFFNLPSAKTWGCSIQFQF